jgi:hypothetical protein
MGGAAEDLHVVLRDVELFGDLCNQVFTHVLLAKFGGPPVSKENGDRNRLKPHVKYSPL